MEGSRPIRLKGSQDESMCTHSCAIFRAARGGWWSTCASNVLSETKATSFFGLAPPNESLMINSMIASYLLNELLFITQVLQEIFFPEFWIKCCKVVCSLTQEMIPSILCLARDARLL